MGFFSSDKALKNDMDLQDLPDLENQRSDVKPRPTSNYLIPTALILFNLFVLVLISGVIYYIATTGDQSARFAPEFDARDVKIAKLEEIVKSLEDPSGLFALEIHARDAKITELERRVEDLEDICNPRKIFADPNDTALIFYKEKKDANGVVAYLFECIDKKKVIYHDGPVRAGAKKYPSARFYCDTNTGKWISPTVSAISCSLPGFN
eukprot:855639_1